MNPLSDKDFKAYSKFVKSSQDYKGWLAYSFYKKEELEQLQNGGQSPEITDSKIEECTEKVNKFLRNFLISQFERLAITEKEDIIKLRRKYAGIVLSIVLLWLIFVMVMILATCSMNCFHGILTPLDDKVLIALISGSSVNIIGLLAIILKYLFPDKRE